MISFKPLENLLKSQGKTKTFLKSEKILGGGTFTTISAAIKTPIKEGVSISAIDDLCKALNCQPSDLIDYIPDSALDK
mgnify:FL=1